MNPRSQKKITVGVAKLSGHRQIIHHYLLVTDRFDENNILKQKNMTTRNHSQDSGGGNNNEFYLQSILYSDLSQTNMCFGHFLLS